MIGVPPATLPAELTLRRIRRSRRQPGTSGVRLKGIAAKLSLESLGRTLMSVSLSGKSPFGYNPNTFEDGILFSITPKPPGANFDRMAELGQWSNVRCGHAIRVRYRNQRED